MSSFVFEVAKRLRQPRQQDSFISFVSSASTIGIGLGCAVLVLLLSVMNGFEYELRNTLLRAVPHAELFAIDSAGLYPDQNFITTVSEDERVSQVFLLNKATGLLQTGKNMKAVSLVGAGEDYLNIKFSAAKSENTAHTTTFASLKATQNGVILGSKIVQDQGLNVGDKVQLLLPANTQDLSFKAPKSAWLELVGEISVGGELDNLLAIVNPEFLSDMLGLSGNVTHIEIQLHDPFEAYTLVRDYGNNFSQLAYMSDWTRTYGHLYQDIQLIRTVVYIVLVLVIAVACFNIVSALIMSVKEKSKEIAILKTIGATGQQIAGIFIIKGLYHGLKGAFIGTIIGILLALYLSDILMWMEQYLGLQVLSDIYFTSRVPSQLLWSDVGITVVIVIAISVLATLYPAKKAAGIKPAANLH